MFRQFSLDLHCHVPCKNIVAMPTDGSVCLGGSTSEELVFFTGECGAGIFLLNSSESICYDSRVQL